LNTRQSLFGSFEAEFLSVNEKDLFEKDKTVSLKKNEERRKFSPKKEERCLF